MPVPAASTPRGANGVSRMHIATPFDPIEVGETDNFAFDFTADVGAAKIESTQWMCALAPYQMANDPAPQSRIISVSAQSAIHVRSPVNGSLLTRDGSFSVALIGGMPPSAAGAIYILAATANLSDGRVLKLNATLQCKVPGP